LIVGQKPVAQRAQVGGLFHGDAAGALRYGFFRGEAGAEPVADLLERDAGRPPGTRVGCFRRLRTRNRSLRTAAAT
jgi:uracil-DNA glycosylase